MTENFRVSALLGESACRRRLPILCYPAELFRRRLETLRGSEPPCFRSKRPSQRLHGRTLPPRGVAITFNDGNYDFDRVAHPIPREFGITGARERSILSAIRSK